MRINGRIKKHWIRQDFARGPWRLAEDPYFETVKTNKQNKSLYRSNIGVYINNNVNSKLLGLSQRFGLAHTVVAINKMVPGQIVPWHTDLFKTYVRKNNIKNPKKIMRFIVFLEDSMPGHQLWIKDKLCHGRAGSYFGWAYGTKHMAANLGEKDRHTLQITGVKR